MKTTKKQRISKTIKFIVIVFLSILYFNLIAKNLTKKPPTSYVVETDTQIVKFRITDN